MHPKKPIILIFIDWYLPGYKAGGPVRSMANLVDHLEDEVEFLIVTRNTDYMSDKPYPDISPDRWTDYGKNARVHYISKNNLSIKNLKEIVRKTPHDLLYINGFFSFYFSILPVWLGKKISRKPVILAPRGMLGSGAISVKPFRKRIFLVLVRLLKIYRPVFFHATNPQEVTDIQYRIDKKVKITVAPNLPGRIQDSRFKIQEKKDPGKLKLVSVARIAPEKNTLYAIERLTEEYNGQITFDLYGTIYNKSYFEKCKASSRQPATGSQINFKGPIHPDEIYNTLTEYDFLFMPSRGENFGHIILEAMTAGLPVIISNRTPWRNLEENGVGWDIALDNQLRFHEIIQKCVDMSQEEYVELSKAAFNFANDYMNNPEIIEASKQLFETEHRER